MRLLTRQGYRICDGVDIFDNFLEIFFVFEDKKSVLVKMGGQAMPKLPCSGVLLVLTIALTVIPPAAAGRRATAAETLPKNIVLLLDNSSSMKINDPYSLVNAVAGQFVRDASADTQLAILVFDREAPFVVSLAPTPGQRL